MKQLLLIFFGINCYFQATAQTLTVDAGPDKTFCVTANGNVLYSELGNDLSVTGSQSTFTYRWVAERHIGDTIFTASYFLNDSTSSNPTVINDSPLTPITFYIHVIDTFGNTGLDSIDVYFSKFGMIPPPNYSMTAGDTITISIGVGGGTPPYTYQWLPNANISDVNAASPSVWPTSTTTYYCSVHDALGCPFTFGSSLTVTVYPVSTNEILSQNIKIYPNPTQDLLIIELAESQLKNIKMTDMSGKVVLQQLELLNNQVNISHLPLGVYVLTVEDEKGNIGQFQVLKE